MDAAELIDRLRPARLPDDVLAIGPQDLLAAFGLGLLAALFASLLLRPFLRAPDSPRARLRARLDRLRALEPQARLLGQAELMAGLGGALEADEREALYRPGAAIDHDGLDARILAAAGRR